MDMTNDPRAILNGILWMLRTGVRWKDLPSKLIGDKAYDSNKLDENLAFKWGIEMIAPNRKGCCKTQDGRLLRRYKHRWKVEHFFAWLQNFRKLVTRYECYAENFLAMVQVACIVILFR